MKRLTQIFQALLAVAALIFTTLIATGRLAWRTIRNWWRSRSKSVRESISTLLWIISLIIICNVAKSYYDDAFGRDYWDRELSEQISLHSFADDKWRVYDQCAEKYTTDKVNWVSLAANGDSLAVYALPNKRGYINVKTGQIVIDAEDNDYQKAWVFSNGLAAVMQNGKIGFINAQNEIVIPFQFDYVDQSRKSDFGYIFYDDYCKMIDADGQVGLIDRKGNWMVRPMYDDILTPCTNGYRVVIKEGKYGLLDAACREIYAPEYSSISVVADGIVLTKEGRMWQTDFEGHIVQPFMFEESYYLHYPIGYDECGDILYAFADYAKYEVHNCYGIMNRITGEPITRAIYSDINMLSKELFEVQRCDSYDWHLLDTKGSAVSKK